MYFYLKCTARKERFDGCPNRQTEFVKMGEDALSIIKVQCCIGKSFCPYKEDAKLESMVYAYNSKR